MHLKKIQVIIGLKETHNKRRWAHLFDSSIRGEHGLNIPNWQSLTKPAFLPLTSDYYPNLQMLQEEYQIYDYQIQLHNKHDIIAHQQLIANMITQRLAMDFQYIVDNINIDQDRKNLKSIGNGSDRFFFSDKFFAAKKKNFKKKKKIWMKKAY